MKLRTKAATYGVAGVVLAGSMILAGSALGLISFGSSGVLSVLLTDPPSVPTGVTAVYITYSDIAVHATGFGDSGWVSVPGQGTINTLGLVNLSQTISSAQIPSLVYNMIRFNITEANVEFMGQNYSVTVDSGRLTVPFVGGLKVNSSSASAALVDFSPTVLNLGNQSDPKFTMAAGARALQVPSEDVGDGMKTVGSMASLQGRGWFQSFRSSHSDTLNITGLALSPGSLSFSALNPGSDPLTVRIIVVTQDVPKHQAGEALGSIASSFVFEVQGDGSLKLLGGSTDLVQSLLEAPGYSIAGGATQTFTYSGTMTSLLGGHTIASGTGYVVVLMGPSVLGVESVVAA